MAVGVGQIVLSCSLLDLLSNALILTHTSPYIGIRSLVSLAATSKAYKSLVYDTLHVFQHADLSRTAFLMRITPSDLARFNDQEMDEIFAQRFSTIFSILENRNVLQDVRTLILDGLYLPNTVIEDLVCDQRHQIHLLSIRGVSNLRPRDMARILDKSAQQRGMLSIRAIYLFGQPDMAQEILNFDDVTTRPESITASMGAQLGAGNHMADDLDNFRKPLVQDPYSNSPYSVPGISHDLGNPWVKSVWPIVLEACAGLIAFDAVLCRHDRDIFPDCGPHIATVRLSGCDSCGTCPEGPAYPGISPANHLPLLSPPPLHSSKVEVAQRLDTEGQPYPPLILRCRTCLKDRWCETCNAWWCESCYVIPKKRGPTKEDSIPSLSSRASSEGIKVHNGLCVSKCLMKVLLHGIGEGGMWG